MFSSWVEPPLWLGITLATLRTSGKIPEENDRLIIKLRGITMRSTTSFSSRSGMLAGPVPLLGRELMRFVISSSEIWAMIKLI